MAMWEKFEQLLARYRALEDQLADAAVIADRTRYTQAAKEHGSLAKSIKPYLEYKRISEDIAQAEALAAAAEADPDMKRYAEEELAGLRARHQALHTRLE